MVKCAYFFQERMNNIIQEFFLVPIILIMLSLTFASIYPKYQSYILFSNILNRQFLCLFEVLKFAISINYADEPASSRISSITKPLPVSLLLVVLLLTQEVEEGGCH